MAETETSWTGTVIWGGVSAVLYAALFYFSDEILHLAHTTADACMVINGAETTYYSKPDPVACAAKGGRIVKGNWAYVLVPILIAFVFSLAHGTFTSRFWNSLGLKAASKKQ
jgi:hypothetical protein